MLVFFLLTSTFLPFAVSSDGIDCGRVPPALWCRNAKLTAECGFSEHCERYLNASKNEPIQVTLIYESGCPACNQFITEALYPQIGKLGKYINLENCNSTSEGDALQEAAARRTEELVPEPPYFTPRLAFNNVTMAEVELYRLQHLVATVCDFYVGDESPDFCAGLGFLAYASKQLE